MTQTFMDSLRIEVAAGFRERAFGLIFRSEPLPGQGLLFKRCSAVHTCFMRYAIDVVFLDDNYRILRVGHALQPWRWARCPGARHVLELRSGESARLHMSAGDTLRLFG